MKQIEKFHCCNCDSDFETADYINKDPRDFTPFEGYSRTAICPNCNHRVRNIMITAVRTDPRFESKIGDTIAFCFHHSRNVLIVQDGRKKYLQKAGL